MSKALRKAARNSVGLHSPTAARAQILLPGASCYLSPGLLPSVIPNREQSAKTAALALIERLTAPLDGAGTSPACPRGDTSPACLGPPPPGAPSPVDPISGGMGTPGWQIWEQGEAAPRLGVGACAGSTPSWELILGVMAGSLEVGAWPKNGISGDWVVPCTRN